MAVETKGALLADRYRILRRLGAGGMATVFLAEDERLRRRVAVKRLHAGSPEDVARRFEREARVGASLNHPNLVAVYDTVADPEGVLIVMEYVEGQTLRDEIARGRLAPERALEVLKGVAAALDHAHRHAVVHRDVGPANVLLARDGTVKLADLGIATAADWTRITRSGTVLGTVAYMAPERLDGAPGGPPGDVYALAAVAFEALSGEKAFAGRSAAEVARKVVLEPPPDLTAVLPDAPAAAAGALRGGLAKDPDERPPSAGALVSSLERAYAVGPRPMADPAPARAVRRRRPRALWPVAIVLGALAAAAAAIALASGGGSRPAASPRAPSAEAHGRASAPPARHAGASGAAAPPGAAGSAGAAPSGAAGSGATASASAASPRDALIDLYALAARGEPASAWALATDRLRAEVGGFASFRAQQRSLRSIAFPTLTVIGATADTATVAFRSTAVHSDRTDHCTGSATLVRRGGRWLVDQLADVTCA